MNCSEGTSNWGKFLVISLVPQTAFFLSVLALRLRATSPALNGFILYSQLITAPPVLRSVAQIAYNFRKDHFEAEMTLGQLMKALFTFHSIWNLDFFKLIYDPFCLHPNAFPLQILALEYIAAVYPLLAIAGTYILVKLYYHNWALVVWLWKPLGKCCAWFTRSWNPQTSLVNAFATFFLLAYIKFLSVSFTLLFPAVVLDMMQWRIRSPTYLYYAGTVQFMGREHCPYALLAIANLIVFTLLPVLLLCLYPLRSFQRCLNCCNCTFQTLHIFMDNFQGLYKNRTNAARDYRYFAGGNLILMAAVFLSLVFQMLFLQFWATFLILLVYLVIFSICRPFRKEKHNNLHIVWVSLAMIFYGGTMPFVQQHTQVEVLLGTVFSLLTLSVPLFSTAYVGWKLISVFLRCCKCGCDKEMQALCDSCEREW